MSSERTKMETAILALVIIAILISAGTLFYVMSIVGQLTPLAAIPEGLAELTAAERDLAKALADLGVDIAAIEERLEKVEEAVKPPPPTPTPPSAKKVVWATIAGFYSDWAEAISKDFTAKTGIEVEVVDIDYGLLYEREGLEMAGKTGAFDIITIETLWLPEWAAAGFLEPLNDYIAKTPAEEIEFDDFEEFLAMQLSWKGNVFGLPYYTFAMGVFYRADLFEDPDIKALYYEKYGRELRTPNHEMDWDEFYDIVKFFDEDVDDSIVPYGVGMMAGRFPHIADEWMAMLWGLGGDHFHDDWSIAVNDPIGVDAMTRYVKFLKHAPPGALESGYDAVVAQFQEGLVPVTMAFYLDQWPNVVKTEELIPGAKVGVDTPVGGLGYQGCFALGMCADSKNKDATWEFLKWLAGPEGQYSFAKGGGSSCRKSVLLNSEFATAESRPFTGHFKALHETFELMEGLPKPYIFSLPEAGKLYVEMMIHCSLAATGTVDPKTAMDLLADSYATILGWYPSLSPPEDWVPPE